jgi:hypothetical protein
MYGMTAVLWVVVLFALVYLALAGNVLREWLPDTRHPHYRNLGETCEERFEAWLRIRYGEFLKIGPGERILNSDALIPIFEAWFLFCLFLETKFLFTRRLL